MIDVARPGHDRDELITSVGLDPSEPVAPDTDGIVDEGAYYALLERVADDDLGFPFRYAEAIRPEDFGALGLAVKTAADVEAALERVVRYVVVLTNTLGYELTTTSNGRSLGLVNRPHHRRGAALSNECALAAVVSTLRQITGSQVTPSVVEFRHGSPHTDEHHHRYFGCPVRFDAPSNKVELSRDQLERRTLLADDGLSAYLVAHLEALATRTASRSLVDDVRGTIADSLPDGQPSKSQVARRLGVSERTLHRQLADHGETFQEIATDVRRQTGEALLSSSDHSIVEIAFLTGFSDQTAFSRAFKRWTGLAPGAYRTHHI
ncbi:MAG: AraC family transcriptional regulator ligand-binding domain-containing protein [Actinomycetota bacterium]